LTINLEIRKNIRLFIANCITLLLAVLILLVGCKPFGIIITKDPLSATEHRRLATIYNKKGEVDLAEREYKAAIEIEPNNVDAYLGLGNLYLKRGIYGEAESIFKKALEISPSNAAIYNNLSWVYIEEGDIINAEIYAMKALELDQERAYIYLDTIAVVYINKGEYDKAEENLQKAIKGIPPDDINGIVHLYNHLVELYYKKGDEEEAEVIARELMELEEGRKR
jgi:tetratricopeptide (TPR) repeat protein